MDIDLEAPRLTLPSGASVAFPIEAFARHCLLNGVDELGYLRGKLGDIERFEAARSGRERPLHALIAVLAGDGIGAEVTAEAVRALEAAGAALRPFL